MVDTEGQSTLVLCCAVMWLIELNAFEASTNNAPSTLGFEYKHQTLTLELAAAWFSYVYVTRYH